MSKTNALRTLLFVLAAATTGCAARPQLASPDGQRAMALFAAGESMPQITAELRLDSPAAARALVHDAMIAVQRRWFANRYASH
jgi:hypothetical protein